LAGLIGALVGFGAVEAIKSMLPPPGSEGLPILLVSMITFAAFGACLGAIMSAADWFFGQNSQRLVYGLKVGALLGLISGAVAGSVAQTVYSSIVTVAIQSQSAGLLMFARAIGWCVLGVLIGASYGVKENTLGDLKSGVIGGALGGAIGGVLFDPLGNWIQIGDGTVSRLVAFCVLGAAIGVAIRRFRDAGIRSDKPGMYRTLTDRLPPNPRLRLPPGPK